MSVAEPKQGWLARLKSGLSRTSQNLTQGITDLLTKRKLDAQAVEELEEILIYADLGVATAAQLVQTIAATRSIRKSIQKRLKPLWLMKFRCFLNQWRFPCCPIPL